MIFIRANKCFLKSSIKKHDCFTFNKNNSKLKSNDTIGSLQFINNQFMNIIQNASQHSLLTLTKKITYFNSSQKVAQSKPSPKDLTNEQKLNYMKSQLQANLRKYNLKTVLKLYTLLLNFKTKFTSQFEQDIKQIIQSQVSGLDQQGILMLLQLLYRLNQHYQRNQRIFRSLNVMILKGKRKVQIKNMFPILKMISLLNFPKSSIANFISNLVAEESLKQRYLHLMPSTQLLKTAVIAMQMKQVTLQVKSRILQSVSQTKYEQLIDLVYLYHICQLMANGFNQTVKHQSIIKSVYQIAFNPYSHLINKQENQKQQQKVKTDNRSNQSKQSKQKEPQQPKLQFNQQILKDRNQLANSIQSQFFKKISPKDILKYIDQKMSDLQSQNVAALSFNQKKQIIFLLISNKVKSKHLKKFIQSIIKQSQESAILNVDEFIGLVSQLDQGKQWFVKYEQKYYSYMNLQQKLTIKHYGKKMFNLQISLKQIVDLVEQNYQSLNSEQFRCLLRVLNNFKKEDAQIKKSILSLLLQVQSKVDSQIERLKRQNIKEQIKNQNEKQSNQNNKSKPNES